MKILHITPQAPGRRSGGELGVLQTILSIKNNNDNVVDYVGPDISNNDICLLYNRCYFLKPNNNYIFRIAYLLKGITNSRYRAWKQLDLSIASYDIVVLDFTKLDFVLKKIKEKPVVVKVHNVECDYAKNDYKKNGGIDKLLIYLLSKKQEKRILNKANAIMVLTEKDKNRIVDIYGNKLERKINLNPVCLEKNDFTIKEKNKKLKMLITGSLWYGDNVNGAIWFIEKVFSKLNFDKELIIAGSRPNPKLIESIKLYKDIRLIDSPENMAPFFQECDIVIAPVFDGAGMKVKVAEALSYGKPVIGTNHAFIGYSIMDKHNSFVANEDIEFIEKLTEISEMDANEWHQVCMSAEKLFLMNYSISNSGEQWKSVMNMIIKGSI